MRYLADRVMVMYLGHVVEMGTTDADLRAALSPLYRGAAVGDPDRRHLASIKKHIVLEGDIPSAINPPPGCPFQTRCPRKHQVPGDLCETEVPPVRRFVAAATRSSATWPTTCSPRWSR